MTTTSEDYNIAITLIAGTFILGIFIIFFFSFFYIHQRRQERFKLEKATLQAQFEQEILSSQNEIKEETMKFISRELHDNVVQMLSLVKIQLNNLSEQFPMQTPISQSKEHLTAAIADLRALSKTLNTENVLHEGLAKTIAFELKRIEKVSSIETKLTEIGEQYRLDAQQEIIVFRIFQELIQNILKHAQAKKIEILLEENQDLLKIEVKDDGIGFDFDKKLENKGFESGSGLANMIHRANLLKGSFKCKKAEPHGSISTLQIPIKSSP